MFLRHSWYVAALSSELNERPIARTILGEHVAMYRNFEGRIVAVSDTCAHRGYPLSLGTVVGDKLVCGYHGFTYDAEGTCVAVPGQDRVPSRLAVRTYPLVELGAWVWIWMGHDEPDMTKLPETPWLLESEEWAVASGVAKIDAKLGFWSTIYWTSHTRPSCTTAPLERPRLPRPPSKLKSTTRSTW